MSKVFSLHPSRRTLIKALGATAMAVPLVHIIGCGGGEESVIPSSDSGASTETGGQTDPVSGSFDTWASGGTAAMTVDFPQDSLFETAAACVVSLTGTQTEGPCYFTGEYLDDISEEQTGLPMQLCLRLIDNNCKPLSGYEIEVWHCDVEGIYSGDTAGSVDSARFNSGFCTGNNSQALKSKWFRGTQITDSSGRVNFKSCFPGWYSSRAIHIHFKVKNNNNEELISQFGFDDDFCDEICASHVDYVAHGTPDTHSTNDTVFGRDYEEYQFEVAQNSDGSLLAWKTIQIQ